MGHLPNKEHSKYLIYISLLYPWPVSRVGYSLSRIEALYFVMLINRMQYMVLDTSDDRAILESYTLKIVRKTTKQGSLQIIKDIL